MQKPFFYLLTLLFGLVLVSSCKKEDNGPAPTADFTFTTADLEAIFTNASTNAQAYSWDFGDGSAKNFAMSPRHTYAVAGTYSIVLTVTGNDNSVKTSTQSVTVTAPAPTANFTFVVTILEVAFANTSTNAVSYSWDFGDGSAVSTEVSPSHTFAAPGTYSVTLTIVGKDNSTKTATQPVLVGFVNLVSGGDMTDSTKWTYNRIEAGVNVKFVNGEATFTGGKLSGAANGGHFGIFQAIQVEAGKNYQLDMHVKGSVIDNTWFEVYIDPQVPVVPGDYTPPSGKRLNLNSWDCPVIKTTGVDDKLSNVTCVTGMWNNLTFATSGTVYLMIRCGGDKVSFDASDPLATAPGITIDNVDFHATN